MDALILIDSSLDETSQCRHPAPSSLGDFLNPTETNTSCRPAGLRNHLWHLGHLGTTCTLMDALIDSSLDEASQCRHPAPSSLGDFLNPTETKTACKAFEITCGI